MVSEIVMACGAVANIVKSSLGPVGLDKVLLLLLPLLLLLLLMLMLILLFQSFLFLKKNYFNGVFIINFSRLIIYLLYRLASVIQLVEC